MEKTYRCGLVAMSGDPITNGHLDIIRRASEECREIVVLVADNERKRRDYLFTLEERTAIARRAIAERGIPNVRVIGSSGLMVDVWLREGCDAIFRGVRNSQDLAYEDELAEINALILPLMKGRFHYLDAKPDLKHISSSLVKEYVRNGLDVDRLVPMFIKQMLEERILGQFRVAVTGSIAVGKSHVAKELVRLAREAGLAAEHVNVDEILRDLYDEDSPGAQRVRDQLAAWHGDAILSKDRKSVDRGALAVRIFSADSDPRHREQIVDLTMPHVQRLYRERIGGKRGLMVIEWAQLAEMSMSAWTNCNAVVVDSPDRAKFIAKRSLDPERITGLARLQMSAPEKLRSLFRATEMADTGKVLRYENRFRSDPADNDSSLTSLFESVVSFFPDLAKLKK